MKGRVFRRKVQAFRRVEGEIPGGDERRFAKLPVLLYRDETGEVVEREVQELEAVKRREIGGEIASQSVVRDVQVVQRPERRDISQPAQDPASRYIETLESREISKPGRKTSQTVCRKVQNRKVWETGEASQVGEPVSGEVEELNRREGAVFTRRFEPDASAEPVPGEVDFDQG